MTRVSSRRVLRAAVIGLSLLISFETVLAGKESGARKDKVGAGPERAAVKGQEGDPASRGQRAKPSARRRADDSGQSARALLTAPWFMFRSPDGDFTLDFPQKPERGKDFEGVISVVRTYDVYTDRLDFHLNFQDIGGDPNARDRNEFGPD